MNLLYKYEYPESTIYDLIEFSPDARVHLIYIIKIKLSLRVTICVFVCILYNIYRVNGFHDGVAVLQLPFANYVIYWIHWIKSNNPHRKVSRTCFLLYTYIRICVWTLWILYINGKGPQNGDENLLSHSMVAKVTHFNSSSDILYYIYK